MKKTIIICYGFNGNNSTNANAICVNEILKTIKNKQDFIIVTDINSTFNEFESEINQFKTCFIPLEKNSRKINFNDWKKKCINLIKKMLKEDNIKQIITISFPFEILEIGLTIKREFPSIKWVIYELDPFLYNKLFKNYYLWFIRRLIREFIVFYYADVILLTHELYKQYQRGIYSYYRSKLVDIGIPLLKINSYSNDIVPKGEKKSAVYIGNFYSKIRDPEYMLQIFSELNGVIELGIYGDLNNNIKYKKLENSNISFFNRVSKDDIEVILENTNFLINIGNKLDNQLPSKVLEYIGTGKPIIHFSSTEDDTCLKYLKKYPLALIINEHEKTIVEHVNELLDFINRSGTQKVDSNLLKEIYGEDTVDKVCEKILIEIQKF